MPSLPPSRLLSASPVSTGGAGTIFEEHVGAFWLALLLVRGFAPILRDGTVTGVHFQTERLGWSTDDVLVEAEASGGATRRIISQVKRTFTVSARNDECRKALGDFWRDFVGVNLTATDRLALVTLRGTNVLLDHFVGLLDCARFSRDGSEFATRLATPGLLAKEAATYCEVVQEIVGEIEGRAVSAADVWPFLRLLHVLNLDLNSSTSQTESMIKTLLAYTAQEPDAVGTAESSWNALVREAGEGIPGAKSYGYNDLPESLRQRHAPTGTREHRMLQALSEHSAPILLAAHETIGRDCHLQRDVLVQQALSRLEAGRVLVISGPAGCGKSALAREVVRQLGPDHFTFCFRAVEFAKAHLDEVLVTAQVPANAVQVGAVLAGQGRKLLLVESVERLLESSTRDAFADLLRMLAQDQSWRLILTCRDYSAETVRASFLGPSGVTAAVVVVPGLTDSELERVREAYPELSRPLSSAPLRMMLRNPYFLDRALQIPWPEESPLPVSERQFRARFWQEVVRAESQAGGGMPRRRDGTFVEVALRRARALTPHTTADGLDPGALESLHHDSLLEVAGPNQSLVAPAHDVLEDWAILQWLDAQHADSHGAVTGFAEAVGGFPALRRTYRMWVGELAEHDAPAADGLFAAAVDESGLPAHFRDDTFVAMLLAPTAPTLLVRFRTRILADRALFRRIIHLLRVACVKGPEWLPRTASAASVFQVPTGAAWTAVLDLVRENLSSFAGPDRLLVLGLVEDWVRGVTGQTPYPAGAESAAAIAHEMLPHFRGYDADDERRRLLQVIARIPKGDPHRLVSLLRGRPEAGERDRVSETFREIILDGWEGIPASRDFPDDVIAVAREELFCSEEDLKGDWGYRGSVELETLFGISDRRLDRLPSSAYRGPFLSLLRFHPAKGLAFLHDLLNHSADWYAHPRVEDEHVEPPFEMTLNFPDGFSRRQWCNARLWNLYRGTSVGPYVLQSALMALEQWLLEVAESRPNEVDALLQDTLRRSESGAVSAVVASAATAWPDRASETLLILLRTRECIELDRMRLAHESHTTTGLFPTLDPRDEVYDAERKEADVRPHRKADLEFAIVKLQLGPLRERVHAILDGHRAQLPAIGEQEERDRVWRLALNRMDLRQYQIESAPSQDSASEPSGTEAEPERIVLVPRISDPDLQEIVARSEAQFGALNARLGLLLWAMKVFRGEASTDAAGEWKRRLAQARAVHTELTSQDEPAEWRGGSGIVAAVCVRDHWSELSSEEQEWCAERVCQVVEEESDNWNDLARVQRYDLAADRSGAFVLPALLGKDLPEPLQRRVRYLLPITLTHPVDEVRMYLAEGIRKHLWDIDRTLALRCVNALALQATEVEQLWTAEVRPRAGGRGSGERPNRARPRRNRITRALSFLRLLFRSWRSGPPDARDRPCDVRREFGSIEADVANRVRSRFYRSPGIPGDALESFDGSSGIGAEANCRILRILAGAPDEPVARTAYRRAAETLVGWWDADSDHRSRRERNRDAEFALRDLLEEFLLQADSVVAAGVLAPVLAVIDRFPEKTADVVTGLAMTEDRLRCPERFWPLWELFADKVQRAPWLAQIDNRYADGAKMVQAVFLNLPWNDGVRDWSSLDGYVGRVDDLFSALPPSARALGAYAHFLYHVGARSLPDGLVRIAVQLGRGTASRLLSETNTVFLLEGILRRHVYGRPLSLKQQARFRDAVLRLLDVLVEHGSAAAYRMRDDFVTPLSPSGT